MQMEGVVRGIQADMTKLSKSHSHTSNTVSKLLDKSRKLSVTMKEVSHLSVNTSPVIYCILMVLVHSFDLSGSPTSYCVSGAWEDGTSGGTGEEAGGKPCPPGQQEQLQGPDLPGEITDHLSPQQDLNVVAADVVMVLY